MMHSKIGASVAPSEPEEPAEGILAAVAELWRSAPDDDRHDVIYLACLFPALALIFLTLWIMLPA